MPRFLITLAIPLCAALLWPFVATLLMRLFGARLPLLPFGKEARRAVQLLTFSQSVWLGVLVGCGGFIGMALFECLHWTSSNTPVMIFSTRIYFNAILWPTLGLFQGLSVAKQNEKRRTSAELSKPGLKEISDWDENGFAREKVHEPHGSEVSPKP